MSKVTGQNFLNRNELPIKIIVHVCFFIYVIMFFLLCWFRLIAEVFGTFFTPTQDSMALCLFGAGPLMGYIVFCNSARSFEWRIKNGAIFLGLSTFGWLLFGFIAWLMYPRYPEIGPHEYIALLFLLPGAFAGAIVLLKIQRRRGAGRLDTISKLCLWFVLFALSLGVGTGFSFHPLREKLPMMASGVHSAHFSDGQDFYDFVVKAPMSLESFESYSKSLNLSPVSRQTPRWTLPSKSPDWWSPGEADYPTWSRSELSEGNSGFQEGCTVEASFVDGHVYASMSCRHL